MINVSVLLSLSSLPTSNFRIRFPEILSKNSIGQSTTYFPVTCTQVQLHILLMRFFSFPFAKVFHIHKIFLFVSVGRLDIPLKLGPQAMCLTQPYVGFIYTCYQELPFSSLGNDQDTLCWTLVHARPYIGVCSGLLAMRFTRITSEAICVCISVYHGSVIAGRFVLKSGALLATH